MGAPSAANGGAPAEFLGGNMGRIEAAGIMTVAVTILVYVFIYWDNYKGD